MKIPRYLHRLGGILWFCIYSQVFLVTVVLPVEYGDEHVLENESLVQKIMNFIELFTLEIQLLIVLYTTTWRRQSSTTLRKYLNKKTCDCELLQ